MNGIIEYLDWRGDLSFNSSPFGDVDNLILTQLAYIDFDEVFKDNEEMTLYDAARLLFELHPDGVEPRGFMHAKALNELLYKAATAERFKDTLIVYPYSCIDDVNEEQFYAMTFVLGDGNMYVAFRGTDRTTVGWREDLDMGFICPVPSQFEAVKYLEAVAEMKEENIFTGGHSKGGNLAMYSAAFSCVEQNRIQRIYNNDGPGFPKDVVEDERFISTLKKIISIVPQGSVVGMLFEHREEYSVVKSEQHGLWQHDGFSWEVFGNGFVKLIDRDRGSKLIDRTISEWIASLTTEERERFVTSLYELFSASKAQTIAELTSDIPKLIKSSRQISPETKENIAKALSLLREQAKISARAMAQEYISEKTEGRAERFTLPDFHKLTREG